MFKEVIGFAKQESLTKRAVLGKLPLMLSKPTTLAKEGYGISKSYEGWDDVLLSEGWDL
mgnify:CR=1 FL=1